MVLTTLWHGLEVSELNGDSPSLVGGFGAGFFFVVFVWGLLSFGSGVPSTLLL